MSDAAIALLLAVHQTEQAHRPEPPKVTVTFHPNPLPKSSVKRSPKAAPKALTAAAVPGVAGVSSLTLDAVGFMSAIRQAGKRINKEGKHYFDASLVREDTVKAIQSYIGYDVRLNYGEQEQAARAKALREIKGKSPHPLPPTLQEKSAAYRTLQGYVAGTPNMLEKKVEELKAREVHTVDAIIELEKKMLTMPEGNDKVCAGVELNTLRCLLTNVQDSLKTYL